MQGQLSDQRRPIRQGDSCSDHIIRLLADSCMCVAAFLSPGFEGPVVSTSGCSSQDLASHAVASSSRPGIVTGRLSPFIGLRAEGCSPASCLC